MRIFHTLSMMWCVWIVDQIQLSEGGIVGAPVSPPVSPPVAPPVAPETPPASRPVHCFSSFSTVEVKNIGDVSLAQLKIGDMIRTNDNQHTQVYGFGHYDHDREESFIQMTFDNNNNNDSFDPKSVLEVSPDHFVFVQRDNAKQKSIRAIDVMVGDRLGNRIVTSIDTVVRRGLYSPLTQSGDMMVSGTYASNYVDLLGLGNKWVIDPHVIGHTAFLPQRLFCRYFLETCKNESYINGYGLWAYVLVTAASMVKTIGSTLNIVVPFDYVPTYLAAIALVLAVVIQLKRRYLKK